MKLHGPVLVGTDFSPSSDEALRAARKLADDLHTGLMVCHMLPEVTQIGKVYRQFRGVDLDFEKRIAAKAAEAMHRQLDAVYGDKRREGTMVIDSGLAHAGLLVQADVTGAGMIVVGPGKVADRVVRHAHVPVLVARPSMDGPVIGTTDFSDPSLPALETAAAEARRRHAALYLLHVVEVSEYGLAVGAEMGYPGNPSSGSDTLRSLRASARADLRAAFERFAVEGEVHALSGRAADAIIAHAKGHRAQLVVVGTHGRTGLARLTLGSTAEQVVEGAPCSVLVVRLAT